MFVNVYKPMPHLFHLSPSFVHLEHNCTSLFNDIFSSLLFVYRDIRKASGTLLKPSSESQLIELTGNRELRKAIESTVKLLDSSALQGASIYLQYTCYSVTVLK